MAAGHYRDREFDLKTSRRKDYGYDRHRDRERGDLRDRLRERQRGAEEREKEPSNGYHHRSKRSGSNSSGGSSSGNDNDRRRGRAARRSDDREPGELSSGSESPPPLMPVGDNGVRKLESGALPSPSPHKKRKLSPSARDSDEQRKPGPLLPPPPPLPHSYAPPYPAQAAKVTDIAEDQWWSDGREPGEMEAEDEESAPARNISTSRWAADNDAPEDEDLTQPKARRTTPLSQSYSAEQPSQKKVPSPEAGEVVSRDGSDGAMSESSDSDSDHADEHDANDYMDVDRKTDNEDGNSRSSSESDSSTKEAGASTPESPEQEQQPQTGISMLQGCRSVDEYERLNKINEGTYGVVYRARDKKTGEIVALKKVKMEKEREGFPLTALREINILLSLQHPSIVGVKEVVVGSNLDSIFMVMEYMDHDLKALMEAMKQRFTQSEVKCLMLQLLQGVDHLHDNWVLHRDLKTSNLLLNNHGELKICDFGLSRQYGSPLKPYTQLVVTLWYRAPELLLGGKEYSTAIDMWSLGCIMAELLAKEPLFNGKSEFDQLDKIFRILGVPTEKRWPGFAKLPGGRANSVSQRNNKLREKFPPITSFSGRPTLSEAGFDLLNKLLTYDPDKRITAKDALNHPWFREVPLPKSKEFMPTFPAQNALDRCRRRIVKSPDPLEEQRKKELLQGEIGTGGLFG